MTFPTPEQFFCRRTLRSRRTSQVTTGDQLQLPRLHLEKLVIRDLGQKLILEVLKHTDQDLRELYLDSEFQARSLQSLGIGKI
jgi:hypothetical protein